MQHVLHVLTVLVAALTKWLKKQFEYFLLLTRTASFSHNDYEETSLKKL